jgi:replicative DNA helicase
LPKTGKVDKLARKSMVEDKPLQSEGEQLDRLLDELQRDHAVKEISGWETGFANLSRALDGILPGLYLLIGAPAGGKTALAKQLLDQVVMHNRVPGIFCAFAESKEELRIRTLARLSGLENREIRRGSSYLLHWYGVPKAQYKESDQLPPSWEKVKRAAEEAKDWLELTYLIECGPQANLERIQERIKDLAALLRTDHIFAVIDDCQRLGNRELPTRDRLPMVAEQLEGAAVDLKIPILAVWPDLGDQRETAPHAWAERIPAANVIMVMERDDELTKKRPEPGQAITLHIVKNRGGEKGKLAMDFYPAFGKFAEVVGS